MQVVTDAAIAGRQLVYSPSYPMLMFLMAALPLDDVVVITRNHQVREFCHQAKIAFLWLDNNEDRSFRGLLHYRDRLRTWGRSLSGHSVIFSVHLFDVWGLYLMHVLRESNDVTYVDIEARHPRVRLPLLAQLFSTDLRKVANPLLVYWYMTGIRFDVFRAGWGFYMLGLTPARLARTFGSPSPELRRSPERLAANTIRVLESVGIPPFDILFLDDGDQIGTYSTEAVARVIAAMQTWGLRIAIKMHPAQQKMRFEGVYLPQWIPAEILAAYARKAVVGVYTGALNGASDVRQTVSLLHLAEPKDERVIDYFVEALNSRIGFPRTLEELERLLQHAEAPLAFE